MRETGEPENNETILLSVGGMSCLKIVHSARCPLLSGKHFINSSTVGSKILRGITISHL